MRLQESERERI